MMAKDVVRMRANITNFYKMRAQMQSVSMQLQTMKSQQAMGKAMFGVTRSLQMMNRQMNLPAMQKMMMEFEKQNEMMEFKSEIMEDTMNDALGAEDEEERTDEMVSQILDEVGIGIAGSMANTPMSGVKGKQAIQEENEGDGELQSRLNSLRAVNK